MKVIQTTAGVDWITMTLQKEAHYHQKWLSGAYELLERVGDEGNRIIPMGRQGYDGAATGACFVGSRDTDSIATFSSHHAHTVYEQLYRPDLHISRLDLQVTVKYNKMPLTVARRGYKDAISANDKLPDKRKRNIRIIIGTSGGDTLYIGSPTSEQLGCLYNKGVESQASEYQSSWRYEVRLKNEKATAAYNALIEQPERATAFISAYVSTWYASRGVTIPWEVSNEIELPVTPRSLPSDDEARLTWLKGQVAPAIRDLLERVPRDKILVALGLAEEREVMSS